MTLPFILVIGKMILESSGIQSSISSYYYTVMRDVFVGGLCAIGVFLASYRGYERKDNIAGNLACIFALGTAFFPTSPEINTTSSLIGIAHYVFAAGLFLTLAYFSLALFRKTNPNTTLTPRKEKRNKVYAICGYAILLCIFLIALVKNMPDYYSVLQNYSPVFWLESTALIAFGISWFVKGETILKD